MIEVSDKPQPFTNILGRVEGIEENSEETHLVVTDYEGTEHSIHTATDIDVTEGHWYFFQLLEREDGAKAFTEQTVVDHRGTDENLDDWIYTGHRPPERRRPQQPQTRGSQGSGGVFLSSTQANMAPQKQNLKASADASQSVNNIGGSEMASQESPDTIGMAVGGEKDGNNFRDNILNGNIPTPASVSPEGIFYDYYFDTGDDRDRDDALFYPSYSHAVSYNPVTNTIEDYLTVGLNSNLSVDEFERKPLNLAVVIDISGSMSHPFSEYYYDGSGERQEIDTPREQTKMDAAIEAVIGLTEHLREEDQLGVVLYNSNSMLAKPLRDVDRTDMEAIRDHVEDIQATGSTNLEAGFDEAVEMLSPAAERADPAERESRVIFLTDQMPNTGETDVGPLVEKFDEAAQKGIHTTFVGIGLDTNAELGDQITDVRGANHYFVHSAEEFKNRLDDEFEYMVTPLVYNLELHVEADGYEIEDVYGAPSPEDNDSATLMNVSTLFPSPSKGGENRGGVILLKLNRTDDDPGLGLKAAWEYRDGETETDVITPDFTDAEPEHFENPGIRKAVALGRYAELLSQWAADGRAEVDDPDGRSQWEHQSVSLAVGEYAEELMTLREYLSTEADEVDSELQQEVEILDAILDSDDET